jgi:hypothetical protein
MSAERWALVLYLLGSILFASGTLILLVKDMNK